MFTYLHNFKFKIVLTSSENIQKLLKKNDKDTFQTSKSFVCILAPFQFKQFWNLVPKSIENLNIHDYIYLNISWFSSLLPNFCYILIDDIPAKVSRISTVVFRRGLKLRFRSIEFFHQKKKYFFTLFSYIHTKIKIPKNRF